MESGTITVMALIKAKEGMEDIVKQELLSLVEHTRKESGCLSYDLHQSTEITSYFMFYETWVNNEALDKHMAMPYIQRLIEKSTEIFADPIQVTLWRKES
ncbi:putative quinol monooxygenase [Candidatus Magnetominusculus xianensis]|uniref:Antibiotic biosynthesis monooxygenase n=1 Tax=Candidatus Magnetominusculus xianensis TaxID=1748249 RepID=A0ABR5SAZ0_9BACT|nr:putative quinol monooxygenase [Candidatus Magnetominusculus xianensis]KWT75613.1 antibiotic biosynthesis monooxygenase [Candidatus Magnetominusculus xianensis]MBF0403696.1 antibiotic biosynthesis monooxygenase [Nitrospirota bacterium]